MKNHEKRVARCYSTWSTTYYDEYYRSRAAYPPVHTELLRALLRKRKVKTVLDAGCGPASFLRDIFNERIRCFGFDLTPQMVDEARRIFAKNGLPPENIWQGSVLDRKAFSAYGRIRQKFDAVVCSGVMPHIREEDDDIVIRNLKSAAKQSGVIALEARNQLFALFTLNRYSYQFICDDLIRVDEFVRKNPRLKDAVTAIQEGMRKQFRMDLPPVRRGKESTPGYDEVLSRTHNPLVLKNKFERLGFKEVEIKFYHFHPFPPMFASVLGDSFLRAGICMEDPDDWRAYFMASAFFIIGKI